MSLSDWHKAGWLKPHQTSPQQIADLFGIVDRDLADAARGISADWKFGIAYNAALKLGTILLHAEGWRPEKTLAHYRTIQALPEILGTAHRDGADYLDTCRSKRNIAEYDSVGMVTEQEADELAAYTRELRGLVRTWLHEHHPDLLPPSH
jgi:hypothetical protein